MGDVYLNDGQLFVREGKIGEMTTGGAGRRQGGEYCVAAIVAGGLIYFMVRCLIESSHEALVFLVEENGRGQMMSWHD